MMIRSMVSAVLFACSLSVALLSAAESEGRVSNPSVRLESLAYEYFEGDWNRLPDFDELTPKARGNAPDNLIDIGLRKRTEYFGFRFRGKLVVNQAGTYTFFMDSDDGSRLKVNKVVVIEYDGLHGVGTVKTGKVKLGKGTVAFEVVVFEKTGDEALLLWATLSGKSFTPLSRSSTNLLHYAVQQHNTELVKQLLASHADVNSKNAGGQTPLHLAAQWELNDIAKLLIAAGADIYAQDAGRTQTPLSIALQPSYQGRANPVLEPMLAAVKDPNVKVGSGDYPVHIAARHDLPNVLEALASKNADLSIKNDRGETPLEVAMSYDKLKAFDYLFPRTENVSEVSTNDGQGILHWAVDRRLVKTIASLLKRGEDIDARNAEGETALYLAAWNGDKEIVTALLKAGANPDVPDESGTSPLYAAAWNNHAALITSLVEAGARFESDGNTALHAASWQGNISSVQTLLASKAPVNVQDSDGNTPLHKAAWRGQTAVVKALLSAGADKTIKDSAGFTPADKARDAGKKAEAAATLLRDGE